MSTERYYIDRRRGATALRDRTEDGETPSFGPLAPGVLIFIRGAVGDDGEIVVNDAHLERSCADFNSGGSLRWLQETRERLAKERAKEAKERAYNEWRQLTFDWIDSVEADLRCASASFGVNCEREAHWMERTLVIECGPIGSVKFFGGRAADRIIRISVNLWCCEMDWELRDMSRQGLALLVSYATELDSLLGALAAVCEQRRPTRPVEVSP